MATSVSNVFAATNNWVGGVSGDWNAASNWSRGTVPGLTDDVTVGSAVVIAYSTDAAISVNSLSLGAGGVLRTYANISAKPVLVVRLPSGVWAWPGGIPHKYFILDGHHRVASARLRGVDVEAVVVG
jgi:hypothetical protein